MAVMPISCRDKNRMPSRGDILAASAMGVCNVLCLTGERRAGGDHPQAQPVFDLDSITLLRDRAHAWRRASLPLRRKISYARACCSGCGKTRLRNRSSGAPSGWRRKCRRAQFIQTQFCYDVPLLRAS